MPSFNLADLFESVVDVVPERLVIDGARGVAVIKLREGYSAPSR